MNKAFWKTVWSVALPVAIQGLLYSLLNLVDQVMIGQLGQEAVVAIALASKNSGILFFTLVGLTSGLGILSAQFIGAKQEEKIAKIQGMTLVAGLILAGLVMVVSLFAPVWSMSLFTADQAVIELGASYHRAVAFSYLPTLLVMVYATLLRNAKEVKLPMYADIGASLLNVVLNYGLIFGHFGLPALGVYGAGLATSLSRGLEALVLLVIIYRRRLMGASGFKEMLVFLSWDGEVRFFWLLTLPILLEEMSFIFGASICDAIYGFLGTNQTIAVTLMGPIQGLLISFFGGFSTASSVLIGQELGKNKKEKAYLTAKNILLVGAVLPLLIGASVLVFSSFYLSFYSLSAYSLGLAKTMFWVMLLFLPVKVCNMIITRGILSAGGETKFVLYQSILGTWVFAIPLGYVAAFVLHLPIYLVFVAISVEEIIRVLICLAKMRSRTWLNNLVSSEI